MRLPLAFLLALALTGIASALIGADGRRADRSAATRHSDARHALPATASQGALVIGNTHPAATVDFAGRALRVTP
jgi:hypothetical protein